MTNPKVNTEKITHLKKRPRKLKVLCLAILLTSFYHFLKSIQVLINIKVLLSLPMTIAPFYLVADGITWGILGIFITWSLWTGKSWARKTTLVITLIYTITFWIDLIWIADPSVLQTRWLVNLCLTIIGLPTIYFSLYSKLSQEYFKDNPATIE